MPQAIDRNAQLLYADMCKHNLITMVATGQHQTAAAAREAFAPMCEELQDSGIQGIEVLNRPDEGGMSLQEYGDLMSELKSLGMFPVCGTIEADEELAIALYSESAGFITPVEDAMDWVKKSAEAGKMGVIRQPNVASVVRAIHDARGLPAIGHMPPKELCAVKISPWNNFNHMSVATEAANARFKPTPRDERNTVTAVFTGPGFDEDVSEDDDPALVHRELVDWVVQNHGRMPESQQIFLPNKGDRMKNLNLVGGVFIENRDGVKKVLSMRQAMHDAIERLNTDWAPFTE